MQVQLKEIVNASQEIDRVFSGHSRAKTGFEMALVRRKITPVQEEYYKAWAELLKVHGTRDEENIDRYHFRIEQSEAEKKEKTARKVNIDAVDAYTEEHDELLEAEVEVDYGISIAQVDKAKIEPLMTPDELAKLWWLITDFREE